MNKIENGLQFFNKISFRGPIGLFIVIASFAFLFALLFRVVPAENKDIVLFASGLVIGMAKEVSGFFFGSSKDKADSDKAAHIKDIVNTDQTVKP